MSEKVNPIPDGYHSVTPYLTVSSAREALTFYEEALGAETVTVMAMPEGERVMHAEMRIGDSLVGVGDEWPEMEGSPVAPTTAETVTSSLLIYCEDVDAAFQHAVEAGCTPMMPPETMFWGDRFAKVEDPYGHQWHLATHVEDLAPEEVEQRAAAAFAKDGK